MAKNTEIFFCYAREDEVLRQGLEKQLRALRRQGIVDVWHDRMIGAGTEWERAIDQHLNAAQVILLLVSPDFMDSDYCYGIEMKRAMERHEQGEARVIPIILRPVYWQKAPFGKLQALPTDGVPVTSAKWHNQDDAFFDVAEGIRVAVDGMVIKDDATQQTNQEQVFSLTQHLDVPITIEQSALLASNDVTSYTNKFQILFRLERYDEALVVIEQVVQKTPNNANALTAMGSALFKLHRYNDAAVVLERAILLDPSDAYTYVWKGDTLANLEHYNEALASYEQAEQLGFKESYLYIVKGYALYRLGRYDEALATLDQAIKLDSSDADTYYYRGTVLYALTRYEEALVCFEQVALLDPDNAMVYYSKGMTLEQLKRTREAKEAYKKANQLGYQP